MKAKFLKTILFLSIVWFSQSYADWEVIPFYDWTSWVSCDYYNAWYQIKWTNKWWDYIDSLWKQNWSSPFSTSTINNWATFWFIDVTKATQKAVLKNDASFWFVLKQETLAWKNWPIESYSRLNSTLFPFIVYTYSDWTKETVKMNSSVFFNCSSSLPFVVWDGMNIWGWLTVMDSALPSYKTKTLKSAILKVNIKKTWAGWMKVWVYLLDRKTTPKATTPVTYWVAKSYSWDYLLDSNPNVYTAMDFSPGDKEWMKFAKDVISEWQMVKVVNSDTPSKFVPLSGNALKITIKKWNVWALSKEIKFKDINKWVEPEEWYFRYNLRFWDNWWSQISGGKLPWFAGTYWVAGWGWRQSTWYDWWSMRGSFYGWAEKTNPLYGKNFIWNYAYYAEQADYYGDLWNWWAPLLDNNKWYNIEQYVKLNTPWQHDWILRTWIDWKLVYERKNILIRYTDKLKIESVWMDIYHGWIEPPDHDMDMYIDNLVIAKSYIWPVYGNAPASMLLPPDESINTPPVNNTPTTNTGLTNTGSNVNTDLSITGTILHQNEKYTGTWNDGENGMTRDCFDIASGNCWSQKLGDYVDKNWVLYGNDEIGWIYFTQRDFSNLATKINLTDYIKTEIAKWSQELNLLLSERTSNIAVWPSVLYSKDEDNINYRPYLIVTLKDWKTILINVFADTQLDSSTYKSLGNYKQMTVWTSQKIAYWFPLYPSELSKYDIDKIELRIVSSGRYNWHYINVFKLKNPKENSPNTNTNTWATSNIIYLHEQEIFTWTWNDKEDGITRDCFDLKSGNCFKNKLWDYYSTLGFTNISWAFASFNYQKNASLPLSNYFDVTTWLQKEISAWNKEFNVLLKEKDWQSNNWPVSFYSKEETNKDLRPYLIVTLSDWTKYYIWAFSDSQIDLSTYKWLGNYSQMSVWFSQRVVYGFPIYSELNWKTISKAELRISASNIWYNDIVELYRLKNPKETTSNVILLNFTPTNPNTGNGTWNTNTWNTSPVINTGTTTPPATNTGTTNTGTVTPNNPNTTTGSTTPLVSGNWTEVLNTKMESVISQVSYSLPVSAKWWPKNIIDAWWGWAYDSKRWEIIIWWGWHGDYAGNELYSYNITNKVWKRLTDPTTGPTYKDPNNQLFDTFLSNSWWYYLDWSPTSRHTYDMIEYIPSIDSFCSFWASALYPDTAIYPNLDCYDLTNKKWVKKASLPVKIQYWHSAYDKVTWHIFVMSQWMWNYYFEYLPESDTWLWHNASGDAYIPLGYTAEIDQNSRQMVFTNWEKVYYFELPPVWNTKSYTSTTKTFSLQNKLQASAYPGMTYDSVEKKIALWNGGSSIVYLDVINQKEKVITGSGTPSNVAQNGTFGRFRYDETLNWFVLVNSISGNVYYYKK